MARSSFQRLGGRNGSRDENARVKEGMLMVNLWKGGDRDSAKQGLYVGICLYSYIEHIFTWPHTHSPTHVYV